MILFDMQNICSLSDMRTKGDSKLTQLEINIINGDKIHWTHPLKCECEFL